MCATASTDATANPPSRAVMLKKLALSAGPMILLQLLQQVVVTLATQRVGRTFGSEALAGVSLGLLTFNLFGLMLIIAPMQALDTVAPQAFGAGNLEQVGIACQRAVGFALLLLVPVAVLLWSHAEQILIALGQEPAVAAFATRYLLALSPALPVLAVFESARRFLYAQEQPLPPLQACLVGVVAYFAWIEIGLAATSDPVGAAIAIVCTHLTMLVALLLLLAFRRPHEPKTWPGVPFVTGWRLRAVVCDRRANLRFAKLTASAAVVMTEWLFWEFTCFWVGRLGAVPLAVHSIAYSLVPLCFMLPYGMSMTLSNLVGNALGAGQVARARREAGAAFTLGCVVTAVYATAIFLTGPSIVRLYTSDEAVVDGAAAVWPMVCALLFLDAGFAMCSGVCRALGVQNRAAVCVLVFLWGVGTPVIATRGDSVLAVWTATPVVYALLDVALALSAVCVSWQRVARDISAAQSLTAHAATQPSEMVEVAPPPEPEPGKV